MKKRFQTMSEQSQVLHQIRIAVFNVLFVTGCGRVLVACHLSLKSGVLVLLLHSSPWAMSTMVNVAPHHLFFSLSGTYKEL